MHDGLYSKIIGWLFFMVNIRKTHNNTGGQKEWSSCFGYSFDQVNKLSGNQHMFIETHKILWGR